MYQQRQTQSSPPAGADEVLLPTNQVLAWVGGISAMTLWRWLRSDRVRFPQPALIVNNRRYWSAASIRHWLAEQSSKRFAK